MLERCKEEVYPEADNADFYIAVGVGVVITVLLMGRMAQSRRFLGQLPYVHSSIKWQIPIKGTILLCKEGY